MAELIYKNEVYAIIGAAMEVYNTLGAGFLEPVYQEALLEPNQSCNGSEWSQRHKNTIYHFIQGIFVKISED